LTDISSLGCAVWARRIHNEDFLPFSLFVGRCQDLAESVLSARNIDDPLLLALILQFEDYDDMVVVFQRLLVAATVYDGSEDGL
jgi:hypothetical protein